MEYHAVHVILMGLLVKMNQYNFFNELVLIDTSFVFIYCLENINCIVSTSCCEHIAIMIENTIIYRLSVVLSQSLCQLILIVHSY